MARPLPWSVFRGVATPNGNVRFESIGLVVAPTRSDAEILAGRLPGAPRYPVVAHALPIPGRVAVAAAAEHLPPPNSRRSRRRAA